MPKKLQLKLLSNSGEIISVITCYSGQVSVLRGSSPTELRPYQRALTGSPGRERFSITVDAIDYDPDAHTLIGFGEPGIKSEQTLRQFIADAGASEGSVEALLQSYGLDDIGDKPCSALTADEERRVRLVAASCDANKIVVINEPFEPIESSWRERFAELLVSFARSQGGLVVIPSLSYRPESWVENDSITRIEVGQTTQKTIGFQTRSATTTKLMQQLRSMFGDEKIDRLISSEPAQSHASDSVSSAGILTGVAAANTPIPTTTQDDAALPFVESHQLLSRSRKRLAIRSATVLALLMIGLVLLFQLQPEIISYNSEGLLTPDASTIPNSQGEAQSSSVVGHELVTSSAAADPAIVAGAELLPVPVLSPTTPMAVSLVLDNYPEDIRRSLLETTQGISMGMAIDPPAQSPKKPEEPTTASKSSGNLFKLLENASSKEGEPQVQSAQQPESQQAQYDQESPEDMEARREAIRQKFLEAIRTASEQRDAE